jgi:predicted RNase H-like nuclease
LKILGADLSFGIGGAEPRMSTLVLLDAHGRVAGARSPATLPELAAAVRDMVGDETFLLGVNIPVVVPERPGARRAVENLVQRRLGFRLSHGGRVSVQASRGAVSGESLLAALAVVGHPCLPYPDRDMRRAGLAEVHPGLVAKALFWESSVAARLPEFQARGEVFRALTLPECRVAGRRRRSSWSERAAALDLLLRLLEKTEGFDLRPAAEALASASSGPSVERAASLADAALIAGTVRRYLDSPETCVFLGDRTEGYVILPADGFVRRMVLRESRPVRAPLFPDATLADRLGDDAELRAEGLLHVPGRPQRVEAVLRVPSLYEFDNVDEMLWWKHCRHLSGPVLPTEGLEEMIVQLDGADRGGGPLRLVRSRHRTLSFRFDPPETWRLRLPTRDGRTYEFRVLRAVYEVTPSNR